LSFPEKLKSRKFLKDIFIIFLQKQKEAESQKFHFLT